MRATCKSLYIALLDTFVDAFFTDNVFRLLDRATMQMICNISKNPRLARRVQYLNLAAETVDSMEKDLMMTSMLSSMIAMVTYNRPWNQQIPGCCIGARVQEKWSFGREYGYTSEDKKPASHLSSIPQELLECIADQLDAFDLGNFRLTCKEIAEKVDYVFTNNGFSDRAFLMSDQRSLFTLWQISKHEKYCKSMKRIWFCPARLRPLTHDSERIDDRGLRQERRELKRWHEQLLRQEEDFYRYDYLSRVLRKIFRNFKRAANFPKLRLLAPSEEDDFQPGPCGWFRLQAITSYVQPVMWDDTCQLRHIALFKAVEESGFATEELQVGQHVCEMPMNLCIKIGDFPCANLRSLELRISFLLRSLELQISFLRNDYDHEFTDDPSRRAAIEGFATVMALSKNLEHLLLHLSPTSHFGAGVDERVPDTSKLRANVFHSIATGNYLDGTPIPIKTDGMILPKLKSIDLKYHQISFGQMLKFCSDRRDTLENVKLDNIVEMAADSKHHDVADQLKLATATDLKPNGHIEVGEETYSGSGWFGLLCM